jgi:predicted hydrocarbon binding protein
MSEKPVGAGMFQVNEDEEIWGLNRRFILFSNALFANIFERMETILGPVAKRQIYEVGYSSGKLGADRLKPIFHGGIEQFKQHVNLSQSLGWGKITNIEYDEKTGEAALEYPNTWESEGYKEVHGDKMPGVVTCFMSAGIAAGAISGAMDVEYECEEVLCVSKGDDICKFVLTPMGDKRKVIR